MVEQKKKKKPEGEGEEKSVTSTHKAADAVRPDGCTLVTVGDATLRAQIINRGRIIFLLISCIIPAPRVWEQTGISDMFYYINCRQVNAPFSARHPEF